MSNQKEHIVDLGREDTSALRIKHDGTRELGPQLPDTRIDMSDADIVAQPSWTTRFTHTRASSIPDENPHSLASSSYAP